MHKKVQNITILLVVVLLVGILAACANGTSRKDKDQQEIPSIEIVDSLGRTVSIKESPDKVISMAPNITETLFALGFGDRLIGVSRQCDYPEEALAKEELGDFYEPNIELIVSANPDVLFVGNKAPEEFIEQMENNNIKTISLEGDSLQEIYQTIIDVGVIMGDKDGAETIVDYMKKRVEDITEKVQDAKKPKSYFALSFGEWGDYTAGAGSFIDEMIGLAGGENIASDMDQPWAEYSLEILIEKDPDVILVPLQSGGLDIAQVTGYKELKAIKEGRIVVLDDNLVSRPGPRVIEGLEEMAKGIHPEIFQ